MYLVYKQYVSGFEAGQQAGKIAWLVQYGTGGNLHVDPEFVGYYVGESGLAQAGRAVKEYMVQRFSPYDGRLYVNLEFLYNISLAAEVVELAGADFVFKICIFTGELLSLAI